MNFLFILLVILVNGYLFHTFSYNPIWPCLFCCSVFQLGHWELFHLAPVSVQHTAIIVVIFILSSFVLFCLIVQSLDYFLALQDAPGSPYTFPVSVSSLKRQPPWQLQNLLSSKGMRACQSDTGLKHSLYHFSMWFVGQVPQSLWLEFLQCQMEIIIPPKAVIRLNDGSKKCRKLPGT